MRSILCPWFRRSLTVVACCCRSCRNGHLHRCCYDVHHRISAIFLQVSRIAQIGQRCSRARMLFFGFAYAWHLGSAVTGEREPGGSKDRFWLYRRWSRREIAHFFRDQDVHSFTALQHIICAKCQRATSWFILLVMIMNHRISWNGIEILQKSVIFF